MESLPQELVDRIVGHLTKGDLKKTLFISRSFQSATEKHCGAFSENPQKFLSIYAGYRIQFLRYVHFQPVLPKTSIPSPCHATTEELLERDEHFSRLIKQLFAALKELESHIQSKRFGLILYTPVQKIEGCYHRSLCQQRVHLHLPHELPKLACIRELKVEYNSGAQTRGALEAGRPSALKLDRRILVDLMTRLPHLERLASELNNDDWISDNINAFEEIYHRDFPGLRFDERQDFAAAVQAAAQGNFNAVPNSLKEVKLDFFHQPKRYLSIDQRKPLPNIMGTTVGKDPFSSSLRLMYANLRRLEIWAMIDHSFFWDGSSEASLPTWPYLEDLVVVFHPAAPSGAWYFDGPRGEFAAESSTSGPSLTSGQWYPPSEAIEEDRQRTDNNWNIEEKTAPKFRIKPNDKVIVPLLESMAKAATNMGRLRRAAIWSPLTFDPWDLDAFQYAHSLENLDKWRVSGEQPAWGIAFAAPGEEAFNFAPGESGIPKRQLWWAVGDWRPENKLRALFQGIGGHETELMEYWEFEDYGSGLVERVVFDESWFC
jgi:hypothetical protein